MAEDEDLVRQAELNAEMIRRVEECVDDVINQDTIRDVTSVPAALGGPDGVPGPLTWDMLQSLLQKVYDQPYEAPDYFELSRRIGETREGAKTRLMAELPPERYDTNNPFHYIQRYGMRASGIRPVPMITITGRTISRAEARAAQELGMRRAEALLSSIAGDSVSNVISRDSNGRFVIMGDENEVTQPAQPAREGESAAESEAQAVNLDPQ